MPKMLTKCPMCSAEWSPGTQEYAWQQCSICGYPIDIEEDANAEWVDDEE